AAGGGVWYVKDLVEFRDSRYDDTKDDDYNKNYLFDKSEKDLYAFYGVSSDAVKPVGVADDGKIVNAKVFASNKEYNITDTGIDLTWNPNTNTNSKIHGSIEYYNNQATVSGDFKIVVPVSVTYKWGTIYTNVTLVISKSVHQLPKK
ncbi:MAG: hypothetical protein IIV20_00255, partial [Bacteroidaceae bacterium]|nr:hypothetical protein [Bacteroidaceae bacterium]